MIKLSLWLTPLMILLSSSSLAAGRVSELLGHNKIKVELDAGHDFKKGSKVFIQGQNDEVVAIGEVKEHDTGSVKVKILETINDKLVLTGDKVGELTHEVLEEKKIPGFTSLTVSDDPDLPARYKDLAYLGAFTADGHTLSRSEWLISPFQVQYGVTNDFGLKTYTPLAVDGYFNLGAKYRVVNEENVRLTLNAFGAYEMPQRDWIWQFGGILTKPSNAKFLNHLIFNFTTDPQLAEQDTSSSKFNLFEESDIRNVNEYIFDNWNRLLFGISFGVERQTFGGTFSYMWIWKSFHTSLGIGTRDFTELKFGSGGYYVVYDLFWRF